MAGDVKLDAASEEINRLRLQLEKWKQRAMDQQDRRAAEQSRAVRAEARLTALEQENKRLRKALVRARDDMEHWGFHTMDIIEKDNLERDLAAIDAALTHEDKT